MQDMKSSQEHEIQAKERMVKERESSLAHEAAMTRHLRERMQEKEKELEEMTKRWFIEMKDREQETQEREIQMKEKQKEIMEKENKVEEWCRLENAKVNEALLFLQKTERFEKKLFLSL